MNTERHRHIFLSCGEASGDRYGAALAAALRASDPDIRISGLGGKRLEQAGVEVIQDSHALSVMGFSEVFRALPDILKAKGRIWRWLDEASVDLVVPIDFPGFNGRLAGRARKIGLPVFWLIAPQVWAWGAWRIPGLRAKIDRLGTILPFEEAYFTSRGFDVFPMGHPLMEDYGKGYPFEENIARREHLLSNRDKPLTIGLLPGSRRQELEHLLPVLKVTTQTIIGHLGERDVRFLVSLAPGVDPLAVSPVFEAGVEMSDEPLPELLKRVDLALVCSGTASLEAVLAGVPHEIVYRTGAVNAFIGRRLIRSPHLGLSNLIIDRKIIREHVQEDAAPLPMARNLLRWLARPAERQSFYADARRVRKMCGKPGVWARTAEAILDFLGERAGVTASDEDGA